MCPYKDCRRVCRVEHHSAFSEIHMVDSAVSNKPWPMMHVLVFFNGEMTKYFGKINKQVLFMITTSKMYQRKTPALPNFIAFCASTPVFNELAAPKPSDIAMFPLPLLSNIYILRTRRLRLSRVMSFCRGRWLELFSTTIERDNLKF